MCVTKKQKRKTKYHFVTLHLQNDKKKTFPFELWAFSFKGFSRKWGLQTRKRNKKQEYIPV